MSASALNRKNKPMDDPEVVAKKVATFHKNFNEKTRRRYSNATRRRWNDPAYRVQMKKAHAKRFKDNPHINDESILKAGIMSRLKPSLRKRSKSRERMEANKRLLPKLGKELKIRHSEEERENDYCGVVRE